MADRPTTEQALSELLLKFRTDWTAFNDQVVGFPVPREPTMLSFERGEFRLGFLREEVIELETAISDEKLDDAVDALLDLIYVAVGTLGEMGVTVRPTWDEVQRANMKKRRGEKSTRSGSGGFDAIKPEGWTGPDHLPYLSITGDDVQVLMAMKLGDQDVRVTLDDGNVWGVIKPESRPVKTDQLTLEFDTTEVKKASISLPTDEGLERLELLRKPVHVHHLEDRKPRLLILGHGRHGKDTVCELLANEHDLKFTSSSWFCAERVMMPYFDTLVPHNPYKDVASCFEDRHNLREVWYRVIRDFNRPDATALGRAIWVENDVYCGLRSKAEFHALKNSGAFDYAIWVDASDRLPPEDASSCTVEPWMADFVLDNNGTLDDLKFNLSQLMEYVL